MYTRVSRNPILILLLILFVEFVPSSTNGSAQDAQTAISTSAVAQSVGTANPKTDKTGLSQSLSAPNADETNTLFSKELGGAIIAGTGVLMSALLSSLISYLTSTRLYSTEQRKLQFEAKKHYESKVVDSRIVVYPSAFEMLSNAIKDIEFIGLKKSTLENLLSNLNAWDSKNSIFLSSNAGRACYIFRHKLRAYISDAEIEVKLKNNCFVEKLRDEIAEVELVLKCDIGIFGIEATKDGVFEPQQKTIEDLRKQVTLPKV